MAGDLSMLQPTKFELGGFIRERQDAGGLRRSCRSPPQKNFLGERIQRARAATYHAMTESAGVVSLGYRE
jgi:hypothetical protein